MNIIKTNFKKIYEILKSPLQVKLNENDNFQVYPDKPKMNDFSIFSLCIFSESTGIESENYF